MKFILEVDLEPDDMHASEAVLNFAISLCNELKKLIPDWADIREITELHDTPMLLESCDPDSHQKTVNARALVTKEDFDTSVYSYKQAKQLGLKVGTDTVHTKLR